MLPLTVVSPREAYLERRVQELEAENNYLRTREPLNRFSVLEEPKTIAMAPVKGDTVTLAIAGYAEVLKDHGGVHVLIQELGREKDRFALQYAISWPEIREARDRAGLMQYLNERALRWISEAYFK